MKYLLTAKRGFGMTAILAPTSVLSSLEMAARHCGDTGERLHRAIAKGYPQSLNRRTAQLLDSAGVGVADLQAFLAAAGFSDMDDLRERAGQETNRRVVQPDLYFTTRGNEGGSRSSLRRVLSREQQNLAETLQALEVNGALETAAAAILGSRRRWVLGDTKSFGYAVLFATDLAVALRDVTLVEPTAASCTTALTDAHPSDTLTAFSFRDYSRVTLHVAEQFHALGGTVVAITDGTNSPICAFADHIIVVNPWKQSPLDPHSPTAVAAVGHVLASLTGSGAKGASRRAIRRDEMELALQSHLADDDDPDSGAGA